MKQTVCEIPGCSRVIEDGDIRYLDFTKVVINKDDEKEVKPVHPNLEICVFCMEKVYNKIIKEG